MEVARHSGTAHSARRPLLYYPLQKVAVVFLARIGASGVVVSGTDWLRLVAVPSWGSVVKPQNGVARDAGQQQQQQRRRFGDEHRQSPCGPGRRRRRTAAGGGAQGRRERCVAGVHVLAAVPAPRDAYLQQRAGHRLAPARHRPAAKGPAQEGRRVRHDLDRPCQSASVRVSCRYAAAALSD